MSDTMARVRELKRVQEALLESANEVAFLINGVVHYPNMEDGPFEFSELWINLDNDIKQQLAECAIAFADTTTEPQG